jgi:hypothetical protein
MEGPVITLAGQQTKFAVNGSVADNAIGAAIGTWTSTSDPGDNQIRYKTGGVDQPPLAAKYSFDPGTNQLRMQLASGDGAASSDVFTFVGGIEVDEDHKLTYFLVDNTGARTGVVIALYGDLSFAQETNNLTIALTGGGVAEIQGLNDVQSLTAGKNRIAEFSGDDLLTFAAETDNVIPGSEDASWCPL